MAADPVTLFPLFVDLRGKSVLVVGGGKVATRKVEALLRAGARIRINAQTLTAELWAWVEGGRIEALTDAFRPDWLDQAWLVVAATDDSELNQSVADAAQARRIWANVVDDAERSSAQLPAVVDRGPLQIAVSTAGAAPMLATAIRARLERELEPALGELTCLLRRQRWAIRRRFPDLPSRRAFYERVIDGPVLTALRQQQPEIAEQRLRRALGDGPTPPTHGSVTLVGAGPGNPDLLTLAGHRALQRADVILYDRLAKSVLSLARRDAETIDVGKRSRGDSGKQGDIHALMLAHARAGRHVVRLKGGDPFVFGRGGEELAWLREHGIDYQVVPGITAALACAAHAGIPLTHREHAQRLTLLTGHDHTDQSAASGRDAAGETLAVYMGVAAMGRLAGELLGDGRTPDTPFAVIEHGATAHQRVVAGRLDELPTLAEAGAVAAPALLIIGPVAAQCQTLHWFGPAPETVHERLASAIAARAA